MNGYENGSDRMAKTQNVGPDRTGFQSCDPCSTLANTVRAYQKHLDGIRDFCILTGDYESMLLLLEKPSEPFCPAMSPSTIANYIRFKRGEKEQKLVDASTEQPLKDIFGKEIFCVQQWIDPKNVDQFLSAIGTMHASKDHRESFFDCCKECIVEHKGDKNSIVCRFHKGQPLLWRKGNPKNCSLIENVVRKNTKDGSGYVAQGDSWELLDIREFLLNSNELFDFEIFVMILILVKLFLRQDEVSTLQICSFKKDLSVVSLDGFVDGLGVEIQGKSGKKPVS